MLYCVFIRFCVSDTFKLYPTSTVQPRPNDPTETKAAIAILNDSLPCAKRSGTCRTNRAALDRNLLDGSCQGRKKGVNKVHFQANKTDFEHGRTAVSRVILSPALCACGCDQMRCQC